MAETILVTGATGNTGRHVVAGLLAEGVAVRALVRDPGRARLPEGVEVVGGDITDPGAVSAAAEGATGAYLLWPGYGTEGIEETVAALTGHVRRVVYFSAVAAGEDADSVWGRVEAAVRASGREWTFLRVTGMAANTLVWAEQVRAGAVRAPHGLASRSLVHERDVAAVAVRALLDEGHAGRAYTVTGPESLTQAEQVRILGEETGQPVRWEEQPEEEARAEIAESMGADFATAGLAYWASLVDTPEPVSGDVEAVTGRPALTFRAWARERAAHFTAGASV
ncbi:MULTISPECIES: SDR family oxidoreductase [Nocardiopsis]|uniref:NmrA family protein n=1 Tax=Nocardiopsis dassonvillei (strain ATCC 23218 / DSM 43111 / CIP 107115 / JCM 7437 / KCTC 9190 / NBRC 14626 / NCTC 10488 / NRRL B-5397 / IMRU 509) TaxID=446468 RepID=D7B6T5_NOCDD|nr:NAD(P)H-binding protein [Nocardiopsis dassonvillei]ADH65489.1 NmrA family protein [Nocardiopsis dassonvillei subsp. dassonvillei DSM 43111]NKY79621.1 NAD(P)H-binding protein [Nocardiopsis dassonvillei]VEI90807.1 NAD(P)H azoreductase [Nocardiopsis dassonvillei]